MNAHLTTASGISSALLGHRRVEQDTLVVGTRYSGDWPRYEVLVTTHGAERGERYYCNKLALRALQDGTATPDDLELEIAEDDL